MTTSTPVARGKNRSTMSVTPHEIAVTDSRVGQSAVHIAASIEAVHLDSGNIIRSTDILHSDRQFASKSLGKRSGETGVGSFFARLLSRCRSSAPCAFCPFATYQAATGLNG